MDNFSMINQMYNWIWRKVAIFHIKLQVIPLELNWMRTMGNPKTKADLFRLIFEDRKTL